MLLEEMSKLTADRAKLMAEKWGFARTNECVTTL
jgi:hypothetical protein